MCTYMKFCVFYVYAYTYYVPVYTKWARALNGLRACALEPQKNGQHDNDGFPAHCRQPVLPVIPWIRHRRQPSDVLTDLSGNVARSVLVLRRAVWCENMYHLPNTEISSGSRGGCPGHGLAGESMAAPGTAPWWADMAAARGRAARGAAVRGRAFTTQH